MEKKIFSTTMQDAGTFREIPVRIEIDKDGWYLHIFSMTKRNLLLA